MSELLDLARSVAADAVEHVRALRPRGRVGVAGTKSSPTDLVTAIDRSCEELIRARILAARPDDAFVGEEGQDVAGTSGVEWIVDPIDGTVNFVYGIPRYAVSIAARRDGVDEIGVVVNIATGEAYEATAGGGAWRVDGNERTRLTGPPAAPVDQMLVATGFNYVPSVREHQAAAVGRMLPHVRDIRRIGAAALDLTDLAEGRLDAYVEQGLKPWDHAAGALIAREAGLVVTGPGGVPDERLVVAAPAASVEEFLALVERCRF
ncbi:inositol monophosphatase family protein [Aeromicrobium duanguangcaii]|uniref:inositol monophosphatase family protein n=1 Tax=Aeromicrobium duanguangcaii TaxID=2968086 RepID=UPI002017CB63|nr:inositol monophosphatase [Aeromicrobium duanguangcaii]